MSHNAKFIFWSVMLAGSILLSVVELTTPTGTYERMFGVFATLITFGIWLDELKDYRTYLIHNKGC